MGVRETRSLQLKRSVEGKVQRSLSGSPIQRGKGFEAEMSPEPHPNAIDDRENPNWAQSTFVRGSGFGDEGVLNLKESLGPVPLSFPGVEESDEVMKSPIRKLQELLGIPMIKPFRFPGMHAGKSLLEIMESDRL